MDSENVECESLSANLFNIVRVLEKEFLQKYRYRKSPRKKLHAIRTPALVIDQLKSNLRCSDDLTSCVRTHRNWRPEFLIKYFRDNRHSCKKEYIPIQQNESNTRCFIPQLPTIFSIGLHTNAMKNLHGSNDPSNSSDIIRNFKQRLNIVRRDLKQHVCNDYEAMIICKYWIAHSIPTSNLSTATTRRDNKAMIIKPVQSTNISESQNQTIKRHCNQLYVRVKGKDSSDVLEENDVDDIVVTNESFQFNNFSTQKNQDKFCVNKKDAQMQTLNRTNAKRRKPKKRSKISNENLFARMHDNDKLPLTISNQSIVESFHNDSNDINKADRNEKSKISIRMPGKKRKEHINKFIPVNREIKEITATLRETCSSEKNSGISSEERCGSPKFNDAEVDEEKKDTFKDKRKLISIKTITSGLEDASDVRKIPRDNKMSSCTITSGDEKNSMKTVVSSISSDGGLRINDIYVHDTIRAIAVEETIHPSKKTSKKRNERRSKRRLIKETPFNQELGKIYFSMEDEYLSKARLRNNSTLLNDNKHENFICDFTNLRGSRSYTKIPEEKMVEMAVLKNIKRRIDKDFDELSSPMNETGTEDFLTISQKSSNFEDDRHFYELAPIEDTGSAATIAESRSMPLISSNPSDIDPASIQIHDSISAGAVSEHSNRNSTLSKYFSCTQMSSLTSLQQNEDVDFDDEIKDTVTRNSYLNLALDTEYSCLTSRTDYAKPLSLNNNRCLRSNIESKYDSRSSLESSARYDPLSSFRIDAIDNSNDKSFKSSDIQVSFVEDKIEDQEYFFRGNKDDKKSHLDFEKQFTGDSTLDASKSSKCVDSIDSGVFMNSSLIDFHPHSIENSIDSRKSELKKKHRGRKFNSMSAFDFRSDGSRTDDSLDRRVDDVVKDLTKNLVLCEKRARMKLREMRKTRSKTRDLRYWRYARSRTPKYRKCLYDDGDLFDSPQRFNEDEIVSISTPSLLSLSDSEVKDKNLKH